MFGVYDEWLPCRHAVCVTSVFPVYSPHMHTLLYMYYCLTSNMHLTMYVSIVPDPHCTQLYVCSEGIQVCTLIPPTMHCMCFDFHEVNLDSAIFTFMYSHMFFHCTRAQSVVFFTNELLSPTI